MISRLVPTFRGLVPVRVATLLRSAKSGAYAARGRLLMARNARRSRSGPTVVLLSLGGRRGSPLLARAASQRGYDVHVFAPAFPSYEAEFASSWSRVDPIEEPARCLELARALDPAACLVEIRNVLLPTKALIQRELALRPFGDVSHVTSNSKIRFRELLDQSDLPKVRWSTVADYEPGSLGYPFIVKPETGTGSKGVALVGTEAEYQRAVESIDAIRTDVAVGGDVLLEEFIDGHNLDVTGIYRDGEIYPFTVQLMQFTPVDGAMPASFYLHNPPLDEAFRARLVDRAKATIEAVGVEIGAFTCEMRTNGDGEIFATDFGNRCATPATVSAAAGVSLAGTYAAAMCEPDFEAPELQRACVYQRFVRSDPEVENFSRLLEDHPTMALDVRHLASSYAGVKTLARIAVVAPTFDEMVVRLNDYDLIPPEWYETDLFDVSAFLS